MDFKEQKLKEFKKHIFNKTFSRDGKIYWDEVESFICKALEEQEDEIDYLEKGIKEWQEEYSGLEKSWQDMCQKFVGDSMLAHEFENESHNPKSFGDYVQNLLDQLEEKPNG